MPSGKFNELVEVQLKSSKQDKYKAKVNVWTKLYSTKANVRYVSGSDLIKAGVDTNVVVITVLMRRDSRMSEECFLMVSGNRFEVAAVLPTRKRREVLVTATREI